ncbi:MAG: DUF5714 domain-containing protein [Promethearchaeota archaeon]
MGNLINQVDQHCIVCKEPLLYVDDLATKGCELCGQEYQTRVYCKSGHFICDACHVKGAIEIITMVCENSRSTDPIELMDDIFKYPQIKMHGPEHHYLVPAVILTALKNYGCDLSPNYLKDARARGTKVPGGVCGYWGACGAGVGVGIAISIFTRSSPKKKVERQQSIKAVGKVLCAIADGTEQCCKRACRLAIEEACDILNEDFGINLPCSKGGSCIFGHLNELCNKYDCHYYSG